VAEKIGKKEGKEERGGPHYPVLLHGEMTEMLTYEGKETAATLCVLYYFPWWGRGGGREGNG